MSRNLKVLGLALVAATALTAVMASAASAVTHDPAEFTVGASPWTVKGTQSGPNKFTVTDQVVTCNTADFNGAGTGTTQKEVAVEAVYKECKSEPLGASATVTGFGEVEQENKCWYVLKADGGAELVCDGTGEVTVTALTCQVHVPAQPFASGVTYTTETLAGGKHDLLVHFEIHNIKANHTDGFLCPFGSSGNSEAATLEGTATVTAFDSGGAATDLTWDKTENT